MALNLQHALLAPLSLFAALALGGLISGIDRRLTARLQARKGPPLLQPLWDVVKLAGKKSAPVSFWQSFCARACFGAAALAVVLFALQANLLLIIFVYCASGVFLVLGAMTSLSPYSQTGAQRQLWQMLCCEAVLFSLACAMYLASGGFAIKGLIGLEKPLLVQAQLLYAAFLFALAIKMKKSPFDLAASHHAHQELVRGVYTEFGGTDLAWVEMAHWLEVVLYLGMAALFWPTGRGMIVLPLVSFLGVILLDNVSARLTWRWMTGKGLVVALCAAWGNIFWLIWRG